MILRTIHQRETWRDPKSLKSYTTFTLSCGHVLTYPNKRVYKSHDLQSLNCRDCKEFAAFNQGSFANGWPTQDAPRVQGSHAQIEQRQAGDEAGTGNRDRAIRGTAGRSQGKA